MPQEAKMEPPSIIQQRESVAGWSVDLGDDAATFDILEKAFDYRGDVTLTLKSGATASGYLFDRTRGKTLADSAVRLLPPTSEERVTVRYADIRHIAFSDRDPAAGKSFETWVKKYVEKKLKGEKASIESEPLE